MWESPQYKKKKKKKKLSTCLRTLAAISHQDGPAVKMLVFYPKAMSFTPRFQMLEKPTLANCPLNSTCKP